MSRPTAGDRPNGSAFAHGQRVVIVAPRHPWVGHAGTLIEAPKDAAFPWIVALDDGDALRAAVKDEEIRRV